jgi:kinetochore protein Spc7/SPC105
LEEINKCATQIIPTLEAEYEEVMRELELEQAAVDEIERSDMNYLNELKASITEQKLVYICTYLTVSLILVSSLEVEALRSEVAEKESEVQWLEEKIEETEAQKREAKDSIAEANRVLQIQKNSTSAEIFRLKGE